MAESAARPTETSPEHCGSSSSDQDPRSQDAAAPAELHGAADHERRRKRDSKPTKTRKGTYSARKEEIEDLTKEVRLLTKRLDRLRREQTSRCHDEEEEDEYAEDEEEDEEEEEDDFRLRAMQVDLNANLRRTVRSQQRVLWGAHALLLDWVNEHHVNPLASFIRLGRDPLARQQTLRRLKAQKLQDADRFLRARSAHLDLLKAHHTDSRSETANGDYCCSAFDVVQFRGMRSVQQVFDALLHALLHMEINVSEQLGEITVREDDDTLRDSSVWNHRLVSSSPLGVQQEMNLAIFSQLSETHDAASFGLVAADFVDQDDLNPYRPSVNVRRDMSMAILLTPHRRVIEVNGAQQEELVVVMRRAGYANLHRTDLPMDDSVKHALQESIRGWGDVMLHSIRNAIAAQRVGHWIEMRPLLRTLATKAAAATRRVLCSREELRALDGNALKFPLQSGALATGFVFWCKDTDAPRAFVNRCPHARLELDLDDSDFFCHGFVQCKAHGAFFDPQTGVCLRGPTGTRRSSRQQEKPMQALAPLDVVIDGDQVLLLETNAPPQQALAQDDAYRVRKQQELNEALSQQNEEIEEIQKMLEAKARARIQQYQQTQLKRSRAPKIGDE